MATAKQEFLDGLRLVLPILVAPISFSFITGAISVQKGLSAFEATLMSASVFAGGSQLLALEVWHEPQAWLLVILATISINVRFALQAASVQRKISHFTPAQRWATIATLTDPTWGMSEVRHLSRQVSFWFISGVGVPIYLIWVSGTLAGALLGNLIDDPIKLGLDFAFIGIFIALALPFWKRSGALPVALASGVAAIAAKLAGMSAMYVFVGAMAGVAVAGLLAARKVKRAEAP